MATSELSILVKVKDEASQMLGKVSNSLKGMEASFKSLAVIGGAAVGAVTLVASKAIEDAQEAVRTTKQLEAVLKSTGNAAGLFKEDILDQANALSKMTNFTDDAIVSGQNLLLTFTQIKGPVFQQATSTILDMSAALGQDLKASAIQLGKALNDPVEGVNALRRVGVSFTEEQKEVIKKLVETGQTAEAQKVILKELAVEFGGSAKAVADPLVMLKNRVSEVSEAIGMALLPQINAFLAKVQPVVEKIIAWVEANPKLTANILIATAAMGGFLLIIGSIGLVLPAVIAGISALLSPIGLVAIAIVALIGAFIIFRDRITELFQTLDEKTGVITLMREAWELLVTVYNEYLKPALQELWLALQPYKPYLEALAKVFGTVIVVAIMAVVGVVAALAIGISVLLTAIVKIVTYISDFFVKAFQTAKDVVQSVIDAVERLISAFSRLNAVQGAKNFIGNAVSGVKGLVGLADGGIVTSPTLAMIGEGGEPEAVIPLSKLAGMGSGNGGITVNINGGTYLSENAAGELGDMIINKLRQNMRI